MDRVASPVLRIHDRIYLRLLVGCTVAIAGTLLLLLVTEQRFVSQLRRQQQVIGAQGMLYDVRLQFHELQQIGAGARTGRDGTESALQVFDAGSSRILGLWNRFRAAWAALGYTGAQLQSAERSLQADTGALRRTLLRPDPDRAPGTTPYRVPEQIGAALRAVEVRLAGEALQLTGAVDSTYRLDRALLAALLVWVAALLALAISKYRRRLRLLGMAYAEVHATQTRYEQLLGAANEGILIVGPAGEIRNINRRFCDFIGMKVSALIGATTAQLSGTGTPLLQVIDDAARAADGQTIHVTVPNPDGAAKWIHLECRRATGSADMIVVADDVTRARETELFQRRATRHLETLIASLPLAAISFDIHGKVTEANAAWLKLFRASDGDSAREAWGRIASEGYREHIEAVRRAALDGQLVYEEELRLPSGDGGYRHVNLWAAPLFDVAGTIIGVISICEDVSERVSRLAEQTRQAERTRRALIREIHHRANNSLQGVVGLLSESISEHGLSAADVAPAIARVQSMAAVHGVIAAQSGDIVEIVTLIHEVAHQVAGALGATIVSDYAGVAGVSLPVAAKAAESLAIVVGELVTNAVKHGRWVGAESPRVQLRISALDGCAQVQVRNPGVFRRGPVLALAEVRSGLGLELVRALLPADGTTLRLWEERESVVVAEIRIGPPQIELLALSA